MALKKAEVQCSPERAEAIDISKDRLGGSEPLEVKPGNPAIPKCQGSSFV